MREGAGVCQQSLFAASTPRVEWLLDIANISGCENPHERTVDFFWVLFVCKLYIVLGCIYFCIYFIKRAACISEKAGHIPEMGPGG